MVRVIASAFVVAFACELPNVAAQGPPANPAPAAAAAPNPQPATEAPLPEGGKPYYEPRPAAGYSLADLEGWALGNHPALAEQAARIAAAEGRERQACLYPNPHLAYEGDEIGAAGRAGMQGLAISQEIVRGGKRGLDAAVAAADTAVAEHKFAEQRQRVVSDVRIEFFNTLAAQRQAEHALELERLGTRAAEITEQLHKAQQVSRVDLLQALVERDSAVLAHEAAQFRHQASWRRLCSVVGRPDLAPTPLLGQLDALPPSLEWSAAWNRLRASSPELGAAEAAVERAHWVLCRARQEPVPNLNVMAGIQHDNAVGEDVANVAVEFPLPLWNRNQGNIAAAEAEWMAAQARVRRLELSLYQRLAGAFQSYSVAGARARKFGEQIVPNSRRSYELVTKGYEQQEFSFLQLLMAQRTYYQSLVDHVEALRELHAAAHAIDGLLLTGSLGAETMP